MTAFARCLVRLAHAALVGAVGCRENRGVAVSKDGPLIVFNAGSLARPLRSALNSFSATSGVSVAQENSGSIEAARKLTELHKIPDVLGVSDYEVIPNLLMPEYATWYVGFARNRMVLAYTDHSKGARDDATGAWWEILLRPGVEVGRAEPSLDPNGYRTLLTLQLAERFYRQPGLAVRLLANAPARNVRPKESELVALLEAGTLDYIWSYESIARGAKIRYLKLPSEIDLGSPDDSATYAAVSVRIAVKTPRDSLVVKGQPILYALTIPRATLHPELAERFDAFLLSAKGRRILRAADLDALDRPTVVGTGVPRMMRPGTGNP